MIPAGTPPRVLFYSHDIYGLGHIRITQALAWEVARRRPDAELLILTGASHVAAFELPPNLDYVKLPSAARFGQYAHLPPEPRPTGLLDGVWVLREALIRQTVAAYAPHVVVIDDTPPGEHGEFARALDLLDKAAPRPTLVLGLRDITDEPRLTVPRWRREGAYRLLDRVYDRILVYGQREIFDPVAEYGISPAAAAKVAFTGYLGRPTPPTPPAEIRARFGVGPGDRFVVVTVGGGEAGGPVLRGYLWACRHGLLPGVTSLVVGGPSLPEWTRADLARMAEGVAGLTFVPFAADLPSHLAAADLVVTALGYNTTCEAVGRGTRVLAAPTVTEQRLRAERFAALGLAGILDWRSPRRLARSVLAALDAPPPTARLDFGGLRRFGDAMEEALGPGVTPFGEPTALRAAAGAAAVTARDKRRARWRAR